MKYSPHDTRLVMPSEIYARSYEAAIAEGFPVDRQAPRLAGDAASLAAHLEWLNATNAQITLPNGRRALRVPQIQAWLTYAYTFVGRVDIRVRLTPELEALGGHIDLAIRPSQRGRGFGRHLFEMAIEKARNAGLRRMMFTVVEGNEAGERLCLQQGAVLLDRIEHPFLADEVVRRYVLEG